MDVWNGVEFNSKVEKVETLWLYYSILFNDLEYSNKTKKIKYAIQVFVLKTSHCTWAAKNILF